jgi:hypothetical protein
MTAPGTLKLMVTVRLAAPSEAGTLRAIAREAYQHCPASSLAWTLTRALTSAERFAPLVGNS